MTTLPEDEAATDAALLEEVRAGSNEAEAAFGELYERHHGAAIAIARRCAGAELAPEIAAEAFARILGLLRKGKGPHTTFRAYLAATINSVWVDHVRRDARHVWSGDEDEFAPLLTMGDGASDRAEAQVVASAFGSLPPRWQHALWLTTVEQVDHEEAGRLLDLQPNAVAALVKRAREGLREAYLTEHVEHAGLSDDGACAEIAPLLAGYVRGTVRLRKRQRVENHLELCASCRVAADDLEGIAVRLGAVLLPAVIVVIAQGGRGLGGVLVGDPAVPHAVLLFMGEGAKAAGLLVGVGGGAQGAGGSGGGAGGGVGGGAGVAGSATVVAGVAGLTLAGIAAAAAVALGVVGGDDSSGDRIGDAPASSQDGADGSDAAPVEAGDPASPEPETAPENTEQTPPSRGPRPAPAEAPVDEAPPSAEPSPSLSPSPSPSPSAEPSPEPSPRPSPEPADPSQEPTPEPLDPRIAGAITSAPSPDEEGETRVTIPLAEAEGLQVRVTARRAQKVCIVATDTCHEADRFFEKIEFETPVSGDALVIDVLPWAPELPELPELIAASLEVEILGASSGSTDNDSASYTLPRSSGRPAD